MNTSKNFLYNCNRQISKKRITDIIYQSQPLEKGYVSFLWIVYTGEKKIIFFDDFKYIKPNIIIFYKSR